LGRHNHITDEWQQIKKANTDSIREQMKTYTHR